MNTSNFDTKQRFGFRKHRWAKGLASVLLGLSFVGVGSVVTGTNTVHADELGKADQANASLQEARDKANTNASSDSSNPVVNLDKSSADTTAQYTQVKTPKAQSDAQAAQAKAPEVKADAQTAETKTPEAKAPEAKPEVQAKTPETQGAQAQAKAPEANSAQEANEKAPEAQGNKLTAQTLKIRKAIFANVGLSAQSLGESKVADSITVTDADGNPIQAIKDPVSGYYKDEYGNWYSANGDAAVGPERGDPGKHIVLNVGYDPRLHHTTIHFKNGETNDGSDLDTEIVYGYTGQTVNPGSKTTSKSDANQQDTNVYYKVAIPDGWVIKPDQTLPDGWTLKPGQTLPSFTFSGIPSGIDEHGRPDETKHNKADDDGYSVILIHGKSYLKPGQVPTPGQKIPDPEGGKGGTFQEDIDHPGTVKGLTNNDLNKTITETVTIHVPAGHPAQNQKTAQVQFSRGATVDSVTGEVIEYDKNWTPLTAKLADQTINRIDGYVIQVTDKDGKVVGTGEQGKDYTITGDTVSATDENRVFDVTYIAQTKHKIVKIIDDTDSTLSKTISFEGKTDEIVSGQNVIDKGVTVADGYDFVSGQNDYNNLRINGFTYGSNDTTVEIHVKHHKVQINVGDPKTKAPGVSDKVWGDGTTKTITRTITVISPDHKDDNEQQAKHNITHQTVIFTRTGTYDAVTKTIDWTAFTSKNPSFDALRVANNERLGDIDTRGYDAHVTAGDATEFDGKQVKAKTIDNVDVAKDEAITIKYIAQEHTVDYSFVDDTVTNADGTHSYPEVSHAQAGGQTDQTINLSNVTGFKIPAGYKLATGQTLPPTVTMNMDNPDLDNINQHKNVVIHLVHDTRTITPGKDIQKNQTIPKDHNKPGDQGPDQDIHYNDVHKSMTRNVTITEPGQAAKTDNETITFERTATIDLVNGSVTYSQWAPVSGSASGFNKIDYKTVINGYNINYNGASASDLDAKTPTQADITNWRDSDNKTITVTYDAQGAHQDFQFISTDDSTKGQVVNMDGSTTTDPRAVSISEPGKGGKTGGHYNAPTTPPAGWVIKPGQDDKLAGGTLAPQTEMKAIQIEVEHGITTVKPGDLPTKNDMKPGDHSKPGDDKPNRAISYDDLHKELDRTITVNDPHTGAHTTPDKISFERTATIDNVDGSVSFGDWTPVDPAKNSFAEFDAPAVDGYTSSVTKVDGKTFTTNTDVDGWSDPKVNITYTANDAHQTFHYTDDQGQPVTDGKGQTIADKTVNGKTDGQITKPDMPGFVIDKVTKDGKDVTSDYKNGTLTFDPEDMTTPITVTVSHDKEVIKPGDTTPDPKNPDNKGKDKGTDVPGGGKTDKGTQYNDLHKTITEVVNETLPGQSQKELSRQAIDFERDATIDKVTGEVTYGDWHVADSSARKSFEVVNATGKDGYTPSVSSVAVPATDNTSVENWKDDAHVTNITYTANEAHKNFKFVDGNGKVIDMDGHDIKNPTEDTVSTTVNGHTDETFTAPGLPKGWRVVKDEQGPTGGKFTPGEQDTQTITIEHDTLIVDPTNPNHYKNGEVIPGSTDNSQFSGIDDNELNSTSTRKIVFHWPNGKVPTTLPEGFHLDEHSTDTVTQTITFFRKAKFDLVTGKLTYLGMDNQPAHDGNVNEDGTNEPWDSDPNPAMFPALVIPKVAGYKAKVSLVRNERTVNKQGLVRMNQLFAVNFMALPASVPGDHTIGHEPVDPTKGDDGHKVAPKPGDTTITDDKGGTRVIPGDTDPNKGQDHGTTNPDNPNKGKDEGNKGQDHGSTNPDNPNKGKDEGNKGQDHGTTSPDKPNKGNDEGNKGKDEGSTTPVVPTTPSDSSNGQTPVQTPDQKPEDSDKPVDNSNNKGQGDKQDQNGQTENTKKTSKKTTKKNKKSAKDVNKVTREAKEKQREAMRKHPSSTGVGSDDGVLGSPLMGNNGPVAPTQDQAHMAPEGSPSATVQAATLGTHAVVSNSNNLPQTGEAASKLGLIGLAFASLGGMVALAGTRKRRED